MAGVRQRIVERVTFCGVVLLLAAVFIVRSPNTIDADVAPRFVVLAAAVTAFLFAFVLAMAVGGSGICFPWCSVILLWSAYLVVVGIGAVFATNPSEALFEWLRSVVIFFYFMTLVWLLSRGEKRVETLALAISLICLGLGVVGVIQFVSVVAVDGFDLETTYRIHGCSAHRNLFSQTLLLTAPFAAFGSIVGRGLMRLVCRAGFVLSLGLITVLMTRSVWIAVLIAGFATGGLLMWSAWRRAGQRALLKRMFVVAAVSVFVVAGTTLLLSRFGAATTLSERIKGITDTSQGSAVPRLFLWSRTTRMVLDHPFLGVGAGNWRIDFPRYAGGSELTQDVWSSPQRPHNEPLGVLAETGAIGLFFYLAVSLTFIWWSVRIVLLSESSSKRSLAASLFFAQVGYLVFSLFSFPGERIEHAVLISTVYAMVFATHDRLRPVPAKMLRSATFGLAVVGLVAVAGALTVGIMRMRSEIHVMRAYGLWRAKEYAAVVAEIDQAYSRLSTVDRHAFPLLFYRGAALAKLGDDEKAHEDLVQAQRDSPYKVNVLNSLAVSHEGRGDEVAAEKLWRTALDLHPHYPLALRNLAVLCMRTGRDHEAKELLRRLDPGIPAAKVPNGPDPRSSTDD
jgi:O-antigen ligase